MATADPITANAGTIAIPAMQAAGRKQSNLWLDAWRRLLRNKLAVIGLTLVLLLTFTAIFADWISPVPYDRQSRRNTNQFPSAENFMGTDALGRDVFSRMIYGARISMTVGLGAQLIVLAIGVPLGLISGYYGGRIDQFIMRGVDVMYAFPRLLFVILLMSMLGAGLTNIFIALGLTGWVTITRLVRGQVLSLRQKEYIEAARSLGAPAGRVMWRHLLPNVLTPIIVALTFGIPEAIFTEAALSFIGVGINPPTPSWGQMVGENQQYLRSYWHLITFPALGIGFTMLAFTWLGDGLRDALDPRLK